MINKVIKIFFFIFFILLPFFLFCTPTHAAISPCSALTSSQAVPVGFGAAYDVDIPSKLLIKASCDDNAKSATISIGDGSSDTYIYKKSYFYRNNKWEEFIINSGDATSGDWLISTGQVTINLNSSELDVNNYFVAYTCKRAGSAWKCGCADSVCANNYWQVQSFKINSNNQNTCQDNDSDTYDNCSPGTQGDDGKQIDCDDNSWYINPGAPETCDGHDNNCNGKTDEGCDDDGDGYCDSAIRFYNYPISVCPNTNLHDDSFGNDCNDASTTINPGANEICANSVDDNCNGQVDEGCAYGVTYYVDSTGGNDSNSGTSPDKAWRTINKVNSFSFSAGDSVLFKRGEIFSDVTLKVPNLPDDFTIADYGQGEKPWFDGNKIRPILIEAAADNLTIRNIDISGQGWADGKSSNLSVNNVNNLTIDGIFGNGHKNWDGNTVAKYPIRSGGNCTGKIEIKNCELSYWGPKDLFSGTTDFVGILIDYNQSSDTEAYIHNNSVGYLASDALILWLSTIPIHVYDNKFYNGGENSIDIKSTSNVRVYNNEFFRTPDFTGLGGSGSEGDLIVLHSPNSLNISSNNMIYNNYFHDNPGRNAMRLGGTYGARDNRFFNNVIENCGAGVAIGNKVFNTQVSYNLIKNCNTGIYENNSGDGTKILNNMIFGGNRGISLAYTNLSEVMNNISYVYSTESYPLYYQGYGNPPVLKSNVWFNSKSNKRVIWGKTAEYFTEDYESWILNHPGDIFSDPLLSGPDSGNFHLKSYSPAIDAGVNVGLTEDFEGNSVPQGSAPDIGAYEY